MNKKTLKILIIAFTFGGILITSSGIFSLISNSKFEEMMISTTATVEKVEKYRDSKMDIEIDSDFGSDDGYIVYIKYSVDNNVYHQKYKTSIKVENGSTKTIYYNKDDPNEIALGKEYISGLTSIIFGIVFLVTGLYLFHQRKVYQLALN